MRKILSFLLLLASVSCSAQNFRWGPAVGLGESFIDLFDFSLNYKCGAVAEYSFKSESKGWFLGAESYIRLMSSGYKSTRTFSNGETEKQVTKTSSNTRLYYVDIPLHIGYKFPSRHSTHLFVSAGPYMSYGLAGSIKTTKNRDGHITRTRHDNVFDTRFKRFDTGIGARIGIDTGSHLQLSITNRIGFNNIYRRDYSSKNKYGEVSATYFF